MNLAFAAIFFLISVAGTIGAGHIDPHWYDFAMIIGMPFFGLFIGFWGCERE